MIIRRNIASSLILARPPEAGKLRGFLPLEFIYTGIPACRQAGQQKNPLECHIPSYSGFKDMLSKIILANIFISIDIVAEFLI
jgi:hypothetical protein